MASYGFAALVGVFTAAAAAIDFRLHRIPNYLTVPMAGMGLAYQMARHGLLDDGQGWWWGLALGLAGLAIGFGLLLLPWLLGGGGMGDVKLLAALGAWLGPWYILVMFAISTLFASGIALGVIIWTACTAGVTAAKTEYLKPPAGDEEGPRRPKSRVLPFAVPVALATWVVLAWLVMRGAV